MDLALLQSVSYIAGALGVCVAAFYYVYNMKATRNAQLLAQKSQELMIKQQEQTLQTRQAQLFTNINQFSMSNEWFDNFTILTRMKLETIEDYDEMIADPEKFKAFHMIGNYFEGMGVLVRENLVDVRLVALFHSGVTQWYWNTYGDWIKLVRRERSFPRYMIESEYLSKAVKEYGEEHPELFIESAPVNKFFKDDDKVIQ